MNFECFDERDDDDVSPEAWWAAHGLTAHDLQAFTKTANEAIAKIKDGPAILTPAARIEVEKAFQAAQESEKGAGHGNERILALMEQRGLGFGDYERAVQRGEVVPYRVAAELVMFAEVHPPKLLRQVAEEPPEPDFADYGPIEREEAEPQPAAAEAKDEVVANPYFTVLGHGEGRIVIYQHEKKMITSRGEADWGDLALTALAPLHWWELEFPAKEGFNRKLAVNWLQRTAFNLPIFDPDTLRGRGAWIDDGRFVFHFGHMLWVDGTMMDVAKIDSTYVYEQGRRLRLPHKDPLSSADGRKVYDTFLEFHWTRQSSAILLAGWCALAPLAGALRWRPHVWITGGAGAGKSTVLNLVNWLMAGTALYSQGNSTEAGIRQALRIDSRPVIFDESEQNNDKEVARIQNILSLIRQSSTESEALTFKGTSGGVAMSFVIHSMFCLGSIQVGLKQQADIERISVLTLRPKREGKDGIDTSTASENWKRISAALAAVRGDPDLPAKLLHRGLKLLPVTVQNIGVFAQAAAEEFGSMREGDQYGALLAGAWSLVSTQVATLEQARAMIARYDWSDYLEGSETEESDKALAALMTSLIRVKSQDVSVFELIQRAAKSESGFRDVSPAEADTNLTRHGLRIEWGGSPTRATAVLVADSHTELKRLMEPTPYAADLKGQLRRLPGAAKTEKKVRFNGPGVYATRIPIGLVLDGAEQMASAPRPDNDDFDDSSFNSDAA